MDTRKKKIDERETTCSVLKRSVPICRTAKKAPPEIGGAFFVIAMKAFSERALPVYFKLKGRNFFALVI